MAGKYRFIMPSEHEMIGLAIAIYGTLVALFARIVHMVRITPHPHLHRKPWIRTSGVHR